MAEMRIPLASPEREYVCLKEKIDEAVSRVLSGGRYILGKEVEEFEKEVSSYLGVDYVVGVSSGTDALLVSLMTEDFPPGSEVITTSFSFIATSSVIVRAGCIPVFVDIEEDGFNIDPEVVVEAVTPKTRAIVVVHLFGQPARLEPIEKALDNRPIRLIEDCAQSFGARFKNRMTGTAGDYGCFSFFPAKVLGCAGDGGAVVCRDRDRFFKLRSLRLQGAESKNLHSYVGGNFRLDAIQAAILRVKLSVVDRWVEARRRNAEFYINALSHLSDRVKLPESRRETNSVWAQFTIRAYKRDELKRFLNEKGIGAEVYYPVPMPYQECMRKYLDYGRFRSFPRAEKACSEVLSIPVHGLLSENELEEVAGRIREFYRKYA